MKRHLQNIIWVLLLSTNLAIGLGSTASAAAGDLKWLEPTYGNIGSSSAINPQYDYRYVGSASHYVYAYNSMGDFQWRFKAGSYVGHHPPSPTVSADGTAVYDGNVYALNALTGVELTRHPS